MFYGLLAELIGAALIIDSGTLAVAAPAELAASGLVAGATATPSRSNANSCCRFGSATSQIHEAAAQEGYPCRSRKTGAGQRDADQVAAMRPARQIANSAISNASNDRVMRNEGDTQ